MTTTVNDDIMPHLINIMNTEKRYWFKIGNGVPKVDAMTEYSNEMEQIAIEESINRQMQILDNMKPKNPLEKINMEVSVIMDSSLSNNMFECGICYENLSYDKSVQLNCNHIFCGECVVKTIRTCFVNDVHASCAMCRAKYAKLTMRTETMQEMIRNYNSINK